MERPDPLMRSRARELRKSQTDAEQKLWQALKKRQIQGFKFRRQYCIGYYIVDFICLPHKLIIEIDGGQHLEQVDYDFERTEFLAAMGYKVIRFWNHEVLQNLECVIENICDSIICFPHPNPPPGRGRELEKSHT